MFMDGRTSEVENDDANCTHNVRVKQK